MIDWATEWAEVERAWTENENIRLERRWRRREEAKARGLVEAASVVLRWRRGQLVAAERRLVGATGGARYVALGAAVEARDAVIRACEALEQAVDQLKRIGG